MPRTRVLTASEQKAFDAPPVLSYAERDTFFQVSERLDAIGSHQTPRGHGTGNSRVESRMMVQVVSVLRGAHSHCYTCAP